MSFILDTNLEILAAFIEPLNLTKFAFFIASILTIPIVLIALNVLWIYLFILLLRNHYRTPSIDQLLQAKSSPTYSKSNQTNTKDYRDEGKLPFVSIIVPARNEQNNIARCLSSLLSQNYPNFEIIAVNDNSSDNTLKIMQEIHNIYLRGGKEALYGLQLKRQEESDKSTYGNSVIFSINSNNINAVQGRRIDDTTVTISLEKNDFKSIDISNKDKNGNNKLKIVSLKKDKPHGWAGKTWASQQGYLCSKGEILILTDADTCYINRDTITSSISYFRKENLDILTGFPLLELRDFWSKIVSPVWKLISTLFGYNVSDINDPKSDAASLMGCFIVIKRKTFEDVGTFELIRDNIREDEALGIRAKQMGYKIKGVRMDKSLTALWSKDFRTLWDGIARTIVPALLNMNGKKKRKVIYDLLAIFLMTTLPFVMLPYSLAITKGPSSMLENIIAAIFYGSNSTVDQDKLLYEIHFMILLLNLSACIGLFAGSAANAILVFKISPIYAIMSPLGATFLLVAYITSILSLMIRPNKLKPVVWRGRKYLPNQ